MKFTVKIFKKLFSPFHTVWRRSTECFFSNIKYDEYDRKDLELLALLADSVKGEGRQLGSRKRCKKWGSLQKKKSCPCLSRYIYRILPSSSSTHLVKRAEILKNRIFLFKELKCCFLFGTNKYKHKLLEKKLLKGLSQVFFVNCTCTEIFADF